MDYQALIIGAGVSGSEAAYALARKGIRVSLLTQSLDTVYLPFTPLSEPGPAESLMSQVGVAGMGGWELHAKAKYVLEAEANIHLFQSSATRLIVEGGRVIGVETWEGPKRFAPKVVLALGSFLGSKLYIGDAVEEAGRLSEAAYPDLYQDLLGRGFGFIEQEAEVPAQAGSPGYRVRYRVFASGEWERETFRLRRVEGLYGLGLCVLGQGSYLQMSLEGMRFAQNFPVENR